MTKERAREQLIACANQRMDHELKYSEYMQDELKSYLEFHFGKDELAKYELIVFDDSFYLGKIQNGKKNGFGAYLWYNDCELNDFYIGYWKDNQFHGDGIYCFKNSQSYCGGFVYNKFEGEKCHWADMSGLVFTADFRNDNIDRVLYSETDFTFNGKHYKCTTSYSRGGSSDSSDSGSSCLGLIIIIAIIWGCFKFCGNCSSSSNSHNNTEISEATTTYICTARKSLKVRTSPSTSASQMGSIMSGEEVEVYSISNGFAKIRYKGDIGYASSKYLRRK